jgi:ABC-type oligopeptide transport system substrate-binding subunit
MGTNGHQLLTGNLNYGGYESETLPALLAERKAARGTSRTAAAARLWTVLTEEVPVAPLCFKRNSLLVRWGMVTNLQPTRSDPFYGVEQWVVVDQ